MAQVAVEFDGYIREQLDERRRAGAAAPADTTTPLLRDTTTALLREETDQGPLSDEQLVSLICNWTVGELGTIAASVGIVGHADDNLLYGAGIHACPGAPLARLELRVLAEELLAGTRSLVRPRDAAPTRARYPAGGFSRVPVEVVGTGRRRGPRGHR